MFTVQMSPVVSAQISNQNTSQFVKKGERVEDNDVSSSGTNLYDNGSIRGDLNLHQQRRIFCQCRLLHSITYVCVVV